MALLALQRATPNLPFQLITPGRTLLKRGPLIQVEKSGAPVEREFLLFSDCMIWLAAAEHHLLRGVVRLCHGAVCNWLARLHWLPSKNKHPGTVPCRPHGSVWKLTALTLWHCRLTFTRALNGHI